MCPPALHTLGAGGEVEPLLFGGGHLQPELYPNQILVALLKPRSLFLLDPCSAGPHVPRGLPTLPVFPSNARLIPTPLCWLSAVAEQMSSKQSGFQQHF